MLSRRQLGMATLATLALPGAASAVEPTNLRRPVLIVQTLLQAREGRRSQLATFLEANWLVMDRQAIDQGLFSHATLLEMLGNEDPADPKRADFIVEVGYFTPGGYADVSAAFNAIRAKHRTVAVEGLLLADLGRIVGERQMRPVAAS